MYESSSQSIIHLSSLVVVRGGVLILHVISFKFDRLARFTPPPSRFPPPLYFLSLPKDGLVILVLLWKIFLLHVKFLI